MSRPVGATVRGKAHLGAVDHDRIGVHRAERGLGIVPAVDRLGPQR